MHSIMTIEYTRVNPLIFIKTPREKETLKKMKTEVFNRLKIKFGTKRIGNKQFEFIKKNQML